MSRDAPRSPSPPLRVLAVDPGRDKCGLAIVDERDGVLARGVVPTSSVAPVVEGWRVAHRPALLVLGTGTASRAVRRALEEVDLPLELRSEVNTTLRARARYFREHPPRGWRRLIPVGLQVPPVPVDDYAAVLIAEDYLSGSGRVRPSPRE